MSGCHPTEYAPVEQKTDIEVLNERLTEAMNAIADMSLRFHKLQSDFREFEKQKIDPKFDEFTKFVDLQTKVTNHMTQRLDDFEERINELEEGDDY